MTSLEPLRDLIMKTLFFTIALLTSGVALADNTYTIMVQFPNGFTHKYQMTAINGGIARQMAEAQCGTGCKVVGVYSNN